MILPLSNPNLQNFKIKMKLKTTYLLNDELKEDGDECSRFEEEKSNG
jgi:hypothetical protein